MVIEMRFQITRVGKGSRALGTLVRFISGVSSYVSSQLSFLNAGVVAVTAFERFVITMDEFVLLQQVFSCTLEITLITSKFSFAAVHRLFMSR